MYRPVPDLTITNSQRMSTPKVDLEIFDTNRTFEDLGLNESLVQGVNALGFVHPTIIQAKLIPLALSKVDVLGQSRTGSGKTAAFGLPALHLLDDGDAFGALILVPTRELAIQVAKEMEVGVVCSGHEAKTVRKIVGPDLLIFTPGIRMNKDHKDDQQRVCTPMESIRNGSDKIIMGRSLIKGNIEENLNQVAESIKT